MLKRIIWLAAIVFAVVGACAVLGAFLVMRDGIGTRREPGPTETALARRLRSVAIPASARSVHNPVPPGQEVFEEGLAHFADHCASCHANDGSGDTEIGRGLYPRAPDMRQRATQQLSDGELFYIIENGVKLTGMPAWGTGTQEGKTASWHLVHFIRRLPALTDSDLERMKALNPKSPDEWRQEEEERRFLEGGKEPPKPPTGHKHGGRE